MRQGSRREEVLFMLNELIGFIMRLFGLDDQDDDGSDERRNARDGRNRRRDERDSGDGYFDVGD
jgi:hypothetical protein